MDWYDLTPELAVLVPHCPEPTQVTELRRAARQFCQDTRVWSRPFQLTSEQGVDRYQVEAEDDAAIVAIDWLSLAGRRLDGRNTGQMASRPGHAAPGTPREYYQYPGGELVLDPVPDAEHVIDGAMSLQPRRKAEGLPEWLGDQWGDGIISLAAARLASMPGKDWTNPNTAQSQMMLYEREVRRAVQQKRAADQPATRVVQYGGL